MDIGKTPLLVAMKKRLAWLGQRQKVLAQNIANADTPNYKPQDLKALKFEDLLGKKQNTVGLSTTSSRHIGGGSRGAEFKAAESRTSYETSPNGNAVILEEQAMKVSETAMNHNLMTQLYKKQLRIFAMAIGK